VVKKSPYYTKKNPAGRALLKCIKVRGTNQLGPNSGDPKKAPPTKGKSGLIPPISPPKSRKPPGLEKGKKAFLILWEKREKYPPPYRPVVGGGALKEKERKEAYVVPPGGL